MTKTEPAKQPDVPAMTLTADGFERLVHQIINDVNTAPERGNRIDHDRASDILGLHHEAGWHVVMRRVFAGPTASVARVEAVVTFTTASELKYKVYIAEAHLLMSTFNRLFEAVEAFLHAGRAQSMQEVQKLINEFNAAP